MRAVEIPAVGEPPRVTERDDPAVPGDEDVLVEVEFVALNPLDLAVASGAFRGGHPPLPFIPGSEAVGRVLAPEARRGERVWVLGDGLGVARDGTLAAQVAVSASSAVPIGDAVESVKAAALGMAGLTGHLATCWRSPVREDDCVVVLGATGTVGRVAVQTARILGARRVVGVGRDRTRLDELLARSHVDAVVQLDDATDDDALKEAAGGNGPTLVVDLLWGEPAVSAVAAAAPGARLVQVGAAAGDIAALPSAHVRGKALDVLGFSVFSVPHQERTEGFRRLLEHAAHHGLDVAADVHPVTTIADAWAELARGGSKVVIDLRSTG